MSKILVIEDELSVRKNIIKILELENFQVFDAENGLLGVESARENNPDLIVCDILMPELNGYQVLSKLQADPGTAMIPFIFLTAKTEKSDRRQGIELGADDYLIKPFDVDDLLTAIKAKLKKQEKFREKINTLSTEVDKLNNFIDTKDGMLENFDQEIRRPLANIKLAIEILQKEESPEQRKRYLDILQEEFNREITLLNQVSELKKLLTPENIALLSQFNMLHNKS